ncbi:protein of unknown function [Kyrpidia spormannii]|uniref:Uncharacterized protein n=1 Tax=Kyrpidia spormannii TaxID=2055160 RepID=A0A6F9EJ45_9BACL|nr:protein of unknown function [Kyrpidia spormannii]
MQTLSAWIHVWPSWKSFMKASGIRSTGHAPSCENMSTQGGWERRAAGDSIDTISKLKRDAVRSDLEGPGVRRGGTADPADLRATGTRTGAPFFRLLG